MARHPLMMAGLISSCLTECCVNRGPDRLKMVDPELLTMRLEKAVWLFPISLTLHNLEEVVTTCRHVGITGRRY